MTEVLVDCLMRDMEIGLGLQGKEGFKGRLMRRLLGNKCEGMLWKLECT